MLELHRVACVLSWLLACTLPGCGGEAEAPLASQCVLRKIALYQAAEVPLMADGAPVADQQTPIIAGRPGMVRLYVDDRIAYRRDGNGDPLLVDADLHLMSDEDREIAVVSAKNQRVGASHGDHLQTTIGLRFDGNALTVASRFYVVLRYPGVTGDIGSVRYPETGTASLGVRPERARLRVRLVPFMYGCDGTDRVPDTSVEELTRLKTALFDLFPVESVTITVREPLPWPSSVRADGEGWAEALDAVMALRNADTLAPTVYDVGVIAPADSRAAFCNDRCVAGLHASSFVTRRDPVRGRAAIVLGYPDGWVADIAHELGHAMGREHAPCGNPDHLDPHYPYAAGRIGRYGYQLSTGRLVGPDCADFMGYCGRVAWVSDYTYAGIFERLALVTAEER